MQDSLDDKIDKLTSMMSKLTAQGNKQNNKFRPKIYQGRWGGQSRIFYDQSNRYRLNSGDRRTSFKSIGQCRQNNRGRPQYINPYRRSLRQTIRGRCKTIEVKVMEVDVKVIIEMTILKEVKVDPEKDNIHVKLAEMKEVVAVGQNQVQEPVLTETELDVLSVGNMIILLKTA